MARKSSQRSFHRIIETYWDNSMGDDKKLQYEFEKYLQDIVDENERLIREGR